jgi:6-phosphogluconolactonase (cycloisomerase 2 family)
VQQYSITPSSGALVVSGTPVAAGLFPIGLVLDPSGQLAYAANDSSGDVSAYAVDATTGALIPVSHSPFAAGSEPRAVAID